MNLLTPAHKDDLKCLAPRSLYRLQAESERHGVTIPAEAGTTYAAPPRVTEALHADVLTPLRQSSFMVVLCHEE